MAEILFGTASFAYEGWKGIVYHDRYRESSFKVECLREYAQYDPGAKLNGPGGDLLFLAWVGFKQTADMFRDCGPDCTRNKFAALMLNGYKKAVSPNCEADFTGGDHHHAAPRMDIFTTVADSTGKPIWIPTQRCLSSLG